MKKDCWDKTKITFEIIFGLIAAGIIAFYGHRIDANLKQKELNVKYVELAIDILNTEPSTETPALRKWAVDVLKKYSPVPLSNEAEEELLMQRIVDRLNEAWYQHLDQHSPYKKSFKELMKNNKPLTP